MRTLIVGGGIAGLTAALALRRAGIAVEVIERAPAWAPVGAGIVLGVNAMRALRSLGVAESIEARGVRVERADVTDAAGRLLQRLEVGRLGGPEVSVALHRAALHEALFSEVEAGTVRLGITPVALTNRADAAAVTFSDGTAGDYNLVIGADGLRSQVRELAFGAGAPVYSGYTCWRMVVDALSELTHPVEMWGRGRRFGLVPICGGRVYCFATLNAARGQFDPPDESVGRFRHRFAGLGGLAPRVVEQIRAPEQLIHNDLEEVVLDTWQRGRVVLIGDAAHASTPNMGQGAAMAIEDAVVLAEELKALPPERALPAFERRRKDRVRWVQNQSRLLGRVGQWESPIGCALRNALVRATPARFSEAPLRRLLEEKI